MLTLEYVQIHIPPYYNTTVPTQVKTPSNVSRAWITDDIKATYMHNVQVTIMWQYTSAQRTHISEQRTNNGTVLRLDLSNVTVTGGVLISASCCVSHWFVCIIVGIVSGTWRSRHSSTANHVLCRRGEATATSSGSCRATAGPIRTSWHSGWCCTATTRPLAGWCSVAAVLFGRCVMPAMIARFYTWRLVWWITGHGFCILTSNNKLQYSAILQHWAIDNTWSDNA